MRRHAPRVNDNIVDRVIQVGGVGAIDHMRLEMSSIAGGAPRVCVFYVKDESITKALPFFIFVVHTQAT